MSTVLVVLQKNEIALKLSKCFFLDNTSSELGQTTRTARLAVKCKISKAAR